MSASEEETIAQEIQSIDTVMQQEIINLRKDIQELKILLQVKHYQVILIRHNHARMMIGVLGLTPTR